MEAPNDSQQTTLTARKPTLLRRVARWAGLRDPYHDLTSILTNADHAMTAGARILWLSQLLVWLRGSTLSPIGSASSSPLVRFRFLVQLLERHEKPRQAVSRIITSILHETEAPSLFAQTELTEQGGIFSEVFRRLGDQILPPPPRLHELAYVVQIVFAGDEDDQWLAALPEDDWLRFCDILVSETTSAQLAKSMSALIEDLRDSILNLAVQTSALGLSDDVRTRLMLPSKSSADSPFVKLNRSAAKWRETLSDEDKVQLLDGIVATHGAVSDVYASVERNGVSLKLVYRLETISGLLRRMQTNLAALETQLTESQARLRARELLIEVVRTRTARRSLSSLLDMNFDIFARRLVQHAGETGEHYITRTRAEYWEMFKAGAGGGILTVATTMLKFTIGFLHLPLLIEGFMTWANYSSSFIAMQFCGFSLATKQPSMTAAALADKLSRTMDRRQLLGFVEEFACISRSQFIAAVGNVGLVIPFAFITNFVFQSIVGRPVLTQAYALKTLHSLHPWQSLALVYAGMTGVLLWLSSFGAGWLENWVVYRGLPDAIAGHRRLAFMLGEQRAKALGEWVRHNASGLGGNIAIGFLLAFVPLIGQVTGLPLDIRHVTLSAGSATFAFCALGWNAITWQSVVTIFSGVAMIGVMNFSVSMACALLVAARARRVRRTWLRALLTSTLSSFRKNPVRFFWPPRGAGTPRLESHSAE